MANKISEVGVKEGPTLLFDLENCKTKSAKIFGLGAALFVIWSAVTFLIGIVFGRILLWGFIALVFAVPVNVSAHLFIRLKTNRPYRWLPFLTYLFGLYGLIVGCGAFEEKEFGQWIVEVSKQLSFLLSIIYAEYFLVDWLLWKVFSDFGFKLDKQPPPNRMNGV